ncbi:MAG TPA: hypothetical protein VFO31_29780 [Vicinamibacterales bacterium]|nr:hypothetical protein [Vicinamibacterales bacterium]
MPGPPLASEALSVSALAWAEPTEAVDRDRWGWVEIFLAVQLLWGAVLFIPGAQAYRAPVRATPYLVSAVALVYYFRAPTGEPLHASAKWVMASFGLLSLNLLHGTTHSMAGVAQIVFQVSIAAPIFWMARAVRSDRRVMRMVWLLFAASFLSSALGILQVYYPNTFLPPEFSTLGREMNPEIISSLTYRGADGREIIRPPGLSDMPGGAAASAMVTFTLGVALAFRRGLATVWRAGCAAAATIGMTALLLTQVRSLSLVAAASLGVFASLRLRQGRAADALASVGVGAVLVIGAFVWAVTVGGDALVDRFSGLVNDGVIHTFREQRGVFLTYTLSELLYEFPLGAGLGRWGMMQVYFGDPTLWQAPPIHVEIQPTGWLLDGGVLLWVAMGGAIVTALRTTYLVSIHAADTLQDAATAIVCLQLAVLCLCLTGPAFNTQLGIQFWAVTGAVLGPLLAASSREGQTIDG